MPETDKQTFERLPTDVVPKNYKLELRPDLQKFTFQGKLSITAEVRNSTKKVVLNSTEIEIQSARHFQGAQDATVTFTEADETVTLEFPSELPVGEATIDIAYTGILNDQMRGFYRSKYTHPDHPDEERYAAVTQFEPVDARRALPCWDEPAHKATFDVTLVVPRDRVALSNMNVVSTEDVEGGLKRVTFARTPVMSPYLLAFIVGEFDYVEATDENGVLVRVYTPVGKAEQGRFALDVAVKTLPFYKDYFNVAYPLPKLDLIAIPDFACGAMENWGLVTYRERRLLVDPVNTPAITKQDVAIVVGHELAHQWFGNLVTMEWWTHLWLNEGFATWIEYLCVDHTHPEFEIWTNFLSQQYASALNLDALSNSHPIEVLVGPAAEVEEIFDAISYRKGASVIRMLYNWIGREDFRRGMHSYLTKFAYQNASTENLWDCLASGKPVSMVMSNWTKKMGYPVLSVEGKQEDQDKRVLTISQKKFCADENITDSESLQWHVPITIATSKNPNALTFVLDQPSASVTLEGVGPDDWILVNPGCVGYYRVSYSADLFSLLLPALRDGVLSAGDRLGLQNDALALAKFGMGSIVDVLRLFASYTRDTNYTVWESLVANLSSINQLLQYTDFHDSFKKFAVKLFAPTVERLGWNSKDTDTTLDTMLRSLVLSQHAKYGGPDTIAEAQKRFQEHMSGETTLPTDLQSTVYSIALANGDESTFDLLIKLHDAADSNEQKVRIYSSLGASNSESIIQRCLDFALSEKVRPQDTQTIFLSVAHTSPKSREMLWNFMKEKWSVLDERYKGNFTVIAIVTHCTTGFVTEEKAQEMEQFFKDHPCPIAERSIKQNCEAARLRARWLQRDETAIREWLAAQ